MESMTRLLNHVFIELCIVNPPVEDRDLLCSVLKSIKTRNRSSMSEHSYPLSARERECLIFLAQGKSLDEIGESMDIKRTTVATFVKRIKTKMRVQTLAQAVYVGLNQNGNLYGKPYEAPLHSVNKKKTKQKNM